MPCDNLEEWDAVGGRREVPEGGDICMRTEVKSVSRVQLFVTTWTVAYQVPQSMGFSRHEYSSGLPFPSPGDPPHPGIKPGSPTLQGDSLPTEPPGQNLGKDTNI